MAAEFDRRAADEAERVAASIMRQLGFADARQTQRSGDGGIDVLSSGGVAQVKWQTAKVGRPALQNLVGAAHIHGTPAMLFFARVGYSAQAVQFADSVGMQLFTFGLDGSYRPVNHHAGTMSGSVVAGQHIAPEVARMQEFLGNQWRAEERVREAELAERQRLWAERKRQEVVTEQRRAQAQLARSQRLAAARERDERVAEILAAGKKPRSAGVALLIEAIQLISLIAVCAHLVAAVVVGLHRHYFSSAWSWVGVMVGLVVGAGVFLGVAAACGSSNQKSEII